MRERSSEAEGLPGGPRRARRPRARKPAESPEAAAAPAAGTRKAVAIWADGACVGNPGPGGYGAVLVFGKHRRELAGGFRRTTNNRMELLGAIVALETLTERCAVVLVSDSRYVVDAMNGKWPERWAARSWRKADGQPAANPDLWQRLLTVAARHDVTWRWVRGHGSDAENCRCDALANAAARGSALLDDDGYVRVS